MHVSPRRLALMLPLLVATSIALAACAPSTPAQDTPTPTTSPTNAPTTAPSAALTSAPLPPPVEQLVLKMSQNPKLGTILTDAQGMTLYTFKNDKPDASHCTGDCAKLWLPLTVPQGVTPTAAQGIPGNIGVLERTDGAYQVLYNDAPLYRYSGDTQPGDTNGNGLQDLWSVVTLPSTTTTSPTTPSAGATDWMMHGFPTILASQEITPSTGITITAGLYSIQVPADAFTVPVKFVVLSGDPATFQAKAPLGQTPILAFAFNVWDTQTNQLISRFNKPVMLTVKDKNIIAQSVYYNLAPDGTYTANSTGMFVQEGELAHPIAGTAAGWVITAPTSATFSH